MQTEINYTELIVKVIDKQVDRIIDGLKRTFKDAVYKDAIDLRIAFKRYLTNAYEKYSRTKTILNRSAPVYLYDYFVCGNVSLNSKKYDCCNVNTILDISKFIIITGTGGMGKSTLLKHFLINEIQQNDLIPLFFEIKDYNNTSDLVDCIHKCISNLGFNMDIKYFEYALKSGCFLMLFDGFDEIEFANAKSFYNKFNEICDKYNNNYYIMTSRPNDSFVSWHRFTVLETIPFSKKQAISLVEKLNYEQEMKLKFKKQLENKLYDTHTSFASNPLLLNIMMMTFRDYAEIPGKLHVFYSNAFETMFSTHDATKGIYKREIKSLLAIDSFKKVLSNFCFRSYLKRKIEFTKEELFDLLNQVKMQTFDFVIEDFVFDLISSVCMLYLEGTKYYFVHRSFQEYFCALHIKDLSDENQTKAVKYIIVNSNSTQDQVLMMLFDMNQERFERNVILPVLESIWKTDNQSEDKFLSCLKFMVDEVLLEPNEKNVSVGVRFTRNAGYFNFFEMLNIAYDSQTKDSPKLTPKLAEELKSKTTFTIENIKNNMVIYKFLKEKSWLGTLFAIVQTLEEDIKKRIDNSTNDLSDLLSI